MKEIKEITVCMGSSCFARGNTENLEYIEKLLKDTGLQAKVVLAGSRCLNQCAEGPNVIIDGTVYHQMSPEKLKEILES